MRDRSVTSVLLFSTLLAYTLACQKVEVPDCSSSSSSAYYPHETSCTLYYRCEDGALSVFTCEDGLQFDPTLSACVSSTTPCDRCTEPRAQEICLETPTCRRDDLGFLKPFPSDCSKFIYCDELSRGIVSKCPRGTQFGPDLGYCTTPEEANCPKCVAPIEEQRSTIVPDCSYIPTCEPAEVGILKPYPPNCTQYIYCDDIGNEILSVCAPNLHFSEEVMDCLPPEEANCPGCLETTSTTEELSTTEASPTIPPCAETPTCEPGENGILKPYPANCSLYIYCDGTTNGVLSICPEGEHFSSNLSDCTLPEEANCPLCESTTISDVTTSPTVQSTTPTTPVSTTPSTTTPVSTTPSTTPLTTTPTSSSTSQVTTSTTGICPPNPTCEAVDVGNTKPYPPDCTKFIYCDEFGGEVFSTCPGGLHFSPSELYCMLPEDANCPLCEITTITPTTVATTSTIGVCPAIPTCALDEEGFSKPYPPDCERYIYCLNDTTYQIRRCPIGQNFSPTLSRCVTPEEALCPYCEATTLVPSTTVATTEVPECPAVYTCNGMSDSGLRMPYPPDCNSYIYCTGIDDDYSLRKCPLGQHFSPVNLTCMAPDVAECKYCLEPTTTTPAPTTPEPTVPPCEDPPTCTQELIGMLLPYPSNCSLYIYCGGPGNTETSNCQPGYEFSYDEQQCLPPEEAMCPVCIPTTSPAPTTEPTTPMPTCPPTPTCAGYPEGTTLPYPPDCSKYIYCGPNGDEELSNCRPDWHFNVNTGSCSPQDVANCTECMGVTTTPITTPTVTLPTTLPVCEATPECSLGEYDTRKPYPPNCSVYVYCTGYDEGPGSLRVCPPGLLFDHMTTNCLSPLVAYCPACLPETSSTEESTSESSTETSTDSPTTVYICPGQETCNQNNTYERLPIAYNCSLYYYCDPVNGTLLRRCATGQLFDQTERRCRPEAEAFCPFCPQEPPLGDPTEAPLCPEQHICAAGETKDYPIPSDCKKYLQCLRGREIIRNCLLPNFEFSPTLLQCVSPDKSDCPKCITPVPYWY